MLRVSLPFPHGPPPPLVTLHLAIVLSLIVLLVKEITAARVLLPQSLEIPMNSVLVRCITTNHSPGAMEGVTVVHRTVLCEGYEFFIYTATSPKLIRQLMNLNYLSKVRGHSVMLFKIGNGEPEIRQACSPSEPQPLLQNSSRPQRVKHVQRLFGGRRHTLGFETCISTSETIAFGYHTQEAFPISNKSHSSGITEARRRRRRTI